MFTLGPDPKVEVIGWPDSGSHALRLNLGDGQQVVLGPEDGPDGAAELADYLVAVAHQCALLAAVLDPHTGRHGLRAVSWPGHPEDSGEDLGESGPGRLPG
ncbi:hypothetical protein [Actinosynnema sp. NPDC020468]|uniref:hypothetical protein n=1 Tax=Actinosynnema sp. NPDC020468 TaxID=3154488 RepID=UPI00340B9416